MNQDRPKEWCSWPEQHNAYFYPSFEGFPALVQKSAGAYRKAAHPKQNIRNRSLHDDAHSLSKSFLTLQQSRRGSFDESD